jgi:hypothetical protein
VLVEGHLQKASSLYHQQDLDLFTPEGMTKKTKFQILAACIKIYGPPSLKYPTIGICSYWSQILVY